MLQLSMTRLFCLLLATAAVGACDRSPTRDASAKPGVSAAKATTSPGPAGKTFGAGVKLTETTPIDAILAEPAKFHGKTVRVEGMITDVCPKRGCWFELAGSGPGQKLRFKVTDGEMVFPMDAKGQRATAEGVIAVRELSIEESKQHAEYQAKEYGIAYDPASITKPTSVVRIDGTGAVLP